MTLLSRYLLRQHLGPFLFAFCALTGFMLLQQIARRLEDLLGKGLPWTVIAEFFALTIPFLVAMTLSMSVLVAVLYTVSRISGDNELTAIRAGGVSVGRLLRPLLAGAGVVALVAFLFGDQVLPRTNHRLRSLMTDIYRTKPTFSLKEHVINEVREGRLALRAVHIDQSTYRMRDITVYDFGEPGRQRIIYADHGRIAFAPNQQDLQLTLNDGTIHEFDREDPRMFQRTAFHRQVVVVKGVGSEFVRRETDDYRGDREMGVCDLEDVVLTARRESWISERRAEATRRNALRSLVGLPPIPPDTANVPPAVPSMYCRALTRLASLIAPAPLQAQQPALPDTLRQAIERLPEPVLPTAARSAPARSTVAQTRMLNDRARSARVRASVYLVELHKKYAIPAACIVFVLVGMPIAARFPRGGVGLTLGAGSVIFGIFYIGLIAGESLANRLIVSPFWAMWAPNVALGLIGIVAIWRMTRQGTAGRPNARALRRAPGAGHTT